MREEAGATGPSLIDLSSVPLSEVSSYGGSRLDEALGWVLSEPGEPVAGFNSYLDDVQAHLD